MRRKKLSKLMESSMKHTHVVALAILLTSASVYADTHETVSDVMKADANHDGKVSFEEYKVVHDARILERFKRRDINNDGFIDLEEKEIENEKKKEQHKAEKKAEQLELREKYIEDRKRRKKHFYKY